MADITKDYNEITNGFNKVLSNKDERLLYTSATLCEIAKVNTDSYESYSNNFNEVFSGTEIKRSNLNQQNFIDDEISVCKTSAVIALARKNNLSEYDFKVVRFAAFIAKACKRKKLFDEFLTLREQQLQEQRNQEEKRKAEEEKKKIIEEQKKAEDEYRKRCFEDNSKIAGTTLKKYNGNDEEIIIPDNITRIAKGAFKHCTGIKRIVVPQSVIRIDRGAFNGCDGLVSITLPFVGSDKDGSGKTHFGYIFGAKRSCGFNGTPISYLYVPSSLKTVVITDSNLISDDAFNGCHSLTSVTIPNSVTKIGNAFSCCSSLISITIPNSVTSINGLAFSYCKSLASITIPNSVTSIGDYAFNECSSLMSITLPNSMTRIGKMAFKNCKNLTSVFIPSSVMSIEALAFYGCKNLTIYCEAESKPSGWSDDWDKYYGRFGNVGSRHVVWGYKNIEI